MPPLHIFKAIGDIRKNVMVNRFPIGGCFMKRRQADNSFLRTLLVLNLIAIIPVVLRKPPLKDWLLVYFFDALTNGIADRFLVANKLVSYPTRFLPKVFKTHILFNYLIHPTFSILFNQFTQRDQPSKILFKLILLLFPLSSFEYWAAKNTSLIRWKSGWKWYSSFVTLTIKSLITRIMIGLVRYAAGKD